MKKLSQNQQIYGYLQSGNTITSIEALQLFDCFKLNNRIHNIRTGYLNPGEEIQTDMVKTDSGKHIAKYKLIKL